MEMSLSAMVESPIVKIVVCFLAEVKRVNNPSRARTMAPVEITFLKFVIEIKGV